MWEVEHSDFKMLEKANYQKADFNKLVEIYMRAAKEKEKNFGSTYSTTFLKNALRAISVLTSKEALQEIKTLDQLEEYLISKANELKMPPYYIVVWTHFVTDKKFGATPEDLAQFMFKYIVQRLANNGFNIEKQKIEIDQFLSKFRKLAVDIKIAPLEFGYRKNSDGSIDIYHKDCHFFEGCERIWETHLLTKSDGRAICGVVQIIIHFLKAATGKEWDQAILEFGRTGCIARCFPT
ncbi:MAG: hypothetical protein QW279_15465 [Candidatus Jordarchaeaceae archaeon]